MEIPRLTHDTPRGQLAAQIRDNLPRTETADEPAGEALLSMLYQILKPRQRQQLERIAMMMVARQS